MVFESGTLEATIAAAAGDDPVLIAELRAAFVESLERQVDLLARARCDGNWHVTVMRLKSLAASFHVEKLIGLCDEALEAAPGEPAVIRRFKAFLDDFSAG